LTKLFHSGFSAFLVAAEYGNIGSALSKGLTDAQSYPPVAPVTTTFKPLTLKASIIFLIGAVIINILSGC
jgi:hypothetical protein